MGRRRGRGNRDTVSRSAPLWMVTYGDMFTLLLAFFIILFSLSTIDARKFERALLSLQEALGFLERGRTVSVDQFLTDGGPDEPAAEEEPELPFILDWEQLADVRTQIEASIESLGLTTSVFLHTEERGLVVRLADHVLFDLGRADLKPEALEVLDRLTEILRGIPNDVRIEGHTDDLPINTVRFPTNWELSTARATSVIRYFTEVKGFSPRRLSAAGYGEYRPVAPNDSEENRRKNRRVDVVILHLAQALQEPRQVRGGTRPVPGGRRKRGEGACGTSCRRRKSTNSLPLSHWRRQDPRRSRRPARGGT